MSRFDFEFIWSALPFPGFIVDLDRRFVKANPAGEQFLANSEKHLQGRKLGSFFDDDSLLFMALAQSQKHRSSLAHHNISLAPIGLTSVICTLYVSFNSAGGPSDGDLQLILIQPQTVAQKMSRSMGNLAAARSATGMAAMLAHEIRNPLAGISGAAQLLAMNSNQEDGELAELIQTESKRIGQLVERVDQFGDQRPVHLQPVNIHDVLDRARRVAEVGYGSHVRFKIDYDPSLPEVAGDRDQMMQIFQNLLKNAAEAVVPPNGQVTIRTSYNSGVKLSVSRRAMENLPIQIEIIDNGHGIPASLINDIFDPFISTKTNGTGLGLPLVSKLIGDLGGWIDCTSQNQKTVFVTRLPIWRRQKG